MVKGPMAAMIATLLEEGWEPEGPLTWTDPDGNPWQMHLDIPNLGLQVRKQIAHHAAQRQWKLAGRHFLAQGIEQGVDLRSFKQELRALRKGLAPTLPPALPPPSPAVLLSMAHRVVQGAIWPNTRRTASGYQPPPLGDRQVEANVCRVCGQLGQGHQYHESWECAAILAAVHPQLRADDDLIAAARLYYTQAPCFWNRALLPWAWTEGLILQRALPTSNWVWGQIPMQVPAEETWMAATDGSGEKTTGTAGLPE